MADQDNPRIDEQLATMTTDLGTIDTAIQNIKTDLDAIVAALPAEEE